MKERFRVLDVFRGIFASLVVFYHLRAYTTSSVLQNAFISNGDLFVDFFFVLSGFVIAYNYSSMASGNELRAFLKKRFFRLYPLHLAILLAYLAVELAKGILADHVHFNKIGTGENTPLTFLTNLLLLNSVKVPGVNELSWNPPSWSISAEMIAYVVFGLAVFGVNRLEIRRSTTFVYLLFIGIGSVALYACTSSFMLARTYDYGFLRGIIGFFTGALCFRTFDALKAHRTAYGEWVFTAFEVICLGSTVAWVCLGDSLRAYGLTYELFFFATVFIFAFEKGLISQLLKRSAVLHRTGKYSYSIYMVHSLVIGIFNVIVIRFLGFSPDAYAWLFAVNYAIVWWLSAVTFNLIEMPFSKPSERARWWRW